MTGELVPCFYSPIRPIQIPAQLSRTIPSDKSRRTSVGALPIALRTGREKLFYVSSLHFERQSKNDRTPALVDSILPENEVGTRCPAVLFYLAKPCSQ